MDVSALNLNISVDDRIRIRATLKLLEEHQDDVDTLGFSLDDIRALLEFFLKNSYSASVKMSTVEPLLTATPDERPLCL